MSSSIAAVTRTVPSLVEASWACWRIANVVPKEVEESDAPAVKAVIKLIFVGWTIFISRNDNEMGSNIPVNATTMLGTKACFNKYRFVSRPPTLAP
jgi:hypothetical protein